LGKTSEKTLVAKGDLALTPLFRIELTSEELEISCN
jgi:hypothetical protein